MINKKDKNNFSEAYESVLAWFPAKGGDKTLSSDSEFAAGRMSARGKLFLSFLF